MSPLFKLRVPLKPWFALLFNSPPPITVSRSNSTQINSRLSTQIAIAPSSATVPLTITFPNALSPPSSAVPVPNAAVLSPITIAITATPKYALPSRSATPDVHPRSQTCNVLRRQSSQRMQYLPAQIGVQFTILVVGQCLVHISTIFLFSIAWIGSSGRGSTTFVNGLFESEYWPTKTLMSPRWHTRSRRQDQAHQCWPVFATHRQAQNWRKTVFASPSRLLNLPGFGNNIDNEFAYVLSRWSSLLPLTRHCMKR